MKSQHKATIVLLLFVFSLVSVEADFDFTVRFYNYWNPTGLCAECGTNGVPVCCDDPELTGSCNNTGVLRCDTRFRFVQRPFNASLETAPSGGFRLFTQGITNENHHMFPEGPGGFLTLPNPHTSTNPSAWTGRIQFLVDAFDRINNNQSPNETEGIVDRFVINLDQLQLGADLTEETTYTGIYNISQLSMSFRVACSESYYGSDCTTFCEAVEGVYTCDSDGNIVCVQENRDPTTRCANCSENYYGSDCTTFCEAVEGVYTCDSDGNIVCVEDLGYDPLTNCTQCKPGRDIDTNCTECLENYYGSDCTTFCESVEGVYTCDSDGNVVCVGDYLEPSTNCSQCRLPNRDPVTNCTSCLPGYIGDSCVMDPCLSSPCENGATCTPDDTTGDYQCECAVGYEGRNCATEIQESKPVSAALIGGVVGGVAGALLLILLVLVVVVLCMTLQLRKQRRGDLAISGNEQTGEPVKMDSFNTNTGGSAAHYFDNTLYGAADDTGKPNTESEYSKLQHHLKTETKQPSKQTTESSFPYAQNGAHTSPPKLEPAEQPMYDSADHHTGLTSQPVYSVADYPPPPSSSQTQAQYDTAYPTLDTYDVISSPPPPQESQPLQQPVYDTADNPPPPSAYNGVKPEKESNAPMYDSADGPPSIYDDTITSPLQQPVHTYDYAATSGDNTTLEKQATSRPVYDYADTPISVSLPKEQLTYDYADNNPVVVSLPTDSPLTAAQDVPPSNMYSELDRPLYSNTTPGEITKESLSHYDFGQ